MEQLKQLFFDFDILFFSLRALGVIFLNLLLRKFYIKFGTAHANRRSLANNFILLSLSIYLIIFLIKGSVALSLGLVGALSIVRFRNAIKESEELVYLFFCIAIGLGFGASQEILVIIIFFMALFTMYLKKKYHSSNTLDTNSIFLHVTSSTTKNANNSGLLSELLDVLKQHTLQFELKRVDDIETGSNYLFVIFIEDFTSIEKIRTSLLKIKPKLSISIVDNSEPLTI